jgi:DNA-binding NarL/FixJ family response regulator
VTRVSIVDDQGVFRAGLRAVLSASDHLEVVSDAPDTDQLLTDADVLIIAEMSGLWHQVVAGFRGKLPSRAVVVILDALDQATLVQARDLGVASCVPRGATPDAFMRAIGHAAKLCQPTPEEVRDEDATTTVASVVVPLASVVSPEPVASEDQSALHRGETEDGASLGSPLSARDVAILASVAAGYSNRHVGDRHGLSDQTVKNRLTSILRKLGAVDRTEAVVTAIRHRWLPLDLIPPRDVQA